MTLPHTPEKKNSQMGHCNPVKSFTVADINIHLHFPSHPVLQLAVYCWQLLIYSWQSATIEVHNHV